MALAPGAWASGEIEDPCGPGATSPSGAVPIYPEPPLAWLDVCSVDVSGVTGAGSLRAVRMTVHLDGDVASGAGAAYYVRFKSEHCYVEQTYRIYPGPQGAATRAYGNCGYRTEPCESPESEVPNYSCGSYVGEFELRESPAMSVAGEGKSITITLDPNKFPAGSLPAGLAHDLGPREHEPASAGENGSEAEETPPQVGYGSLTAAWVHTQSHQGVRGVLWTSGGPGDATPWAGPVPLD